MKIAEKAQARRAVLPDGGLTELLRSICDAGSGDKVSVGDMTEATGRTGIATALLVPSLIALSPATVIFGVATVSGLMIAFIAAQIMLDLKTLWLPERLLKLCVRRASLEHLRSWLEPLLLRIERIARPRLQALTRWPLGHLPGATTVSLGLSLPFLELVPLSATTGGAAATLMTLGLLLDDGLIVLAGMLFAGLVAAIVIFGVSIVLA